MSGKPNDSHAEELTITTGCSDDGTANTERETASFEDVIDITPDVYDDSLIETHIETTFTITVPIPSNHQSLISLVQSQFSQTDWIKNTRDIDYNDDVTSLENSLEVNGTGVLIVTLPTTHVTDSKESVQQFFTEYSDNLIPNGDISITEFSVPPFYTVKHNQDSAE